jgi:TolB protein
MALRTFFASLFFILVAFVTACSQPNVASLSAAQLFPQPDSLPGKLLFVKDGNLWLWDAGRARQFTTGDTWRQPQWSPDGSEIAYVYRSTNFSEIFVMSADGSNSRRLTRSQSSSLSDNDWVFRPTWSPNGTQLAFISDSQTYHPVVWLMNRDGSGQRQLMSVTALQEAADSLSWSPDGKRLAVTAFGQDQSQIVIVDLAAPRSPQPLSDSGQGAFDPAWSPDGNAVAYAVRQLAGVVIRIHRFDGSADVEVVHGGLNRSPVWSPDGTHLAFLSARGGTFELSVVDVGTDGERLSVRNERQLTRDLNVDAASGLSWSR